MRLWPARRSDPERAQLALPFQEYVNFFSFNGANYPFQTLQQTLAGQREEIGSDYTGIATSAIGGNSPVFTCMCVRLLHFTEARFQFQDVTAGRPGKLFGTQELGIVEKPWPGATTGDLLARMIQDIDLAGNSYTVRTGNRLTRLRPDWVTLVLGSSARRNDWEPGDPDTQVIAYAYKPGGRYSDSRSFTYLPEQVAHFAPVPDPMAQFRGMTWITPVIREIQGDTMMTSHKNRFLENGATVNLVVKLPATTVDSFNQWVERFREGHVGEANAYKTLYLASGADASAIGSDMQQMDFANVQGKGETRIAQAAGVPPVIAGFSEGLQGSSLNEGNYRAAARRFADGTIRPLWRNAAGSLERIINVPGGARLWVDERDIAFLKEDIQAAAQVVNLEATAINTLIMAGFDPNAAAGAVTAGDLSVLSDPSTHSGLTSVQLLPPAAGTPAANGANGANGNG